MKILVKKSTGEMIEFFFQPDESIWELSRRLEELGVTLNIEGMDSNENGKIFDYLVPKNLLSQSFGCAVPGCGNFKGDNPEKVFFHFPNEQIRCHQWVLYCQRFETDPGKKRLTLTNQSTICSDHFRPDQFVKNTNTLLKRTAVPCVPDREWKKSFKKTADRSVLKITSQQTAICEQNQGSCNRLCRLCANLCSDFIFIFDELGGAMKLSEKINLCFPFEVKPSDPLPKQICRTCYEQLEDLFSMADLCSISQHKLMDTFSSGDTNSDVILNSKFIDDSFGKCPLCDMGEVSFVNMTENVFENEQGTMLLSPQFTSFDSINDISFNNFKIKIESEGNADYPNILGKDLFLENTSIYESGVALRNPENSLSYFDSSATDTLSVHSMPIHTSVNVGTDPMLSSVNNNTSNKLQWNYCSYISNDITSLSCRICGSQYKEREELLKHSIEHSCKAFYQCAACVAFFTDINEFESHTLLHEQEKYFCNVCQKQYSFLFEINSHLCKPSKCPICIKIFSNEYTFSNHMKSHQSYPYCGICCMVFTDDVKLQKHSLYVHNSKKSHCCGECGKVFKSEASMKYHQRIHQSNERPKPYTCEWCGKNFLRRSMLVSHLSSSHLHSPLRVECITCKICNEAFPDTKSALGHFGNNHETEKLNDSTFCFEMSEVEKIFVCEFCQRSYSSEYALNFHREQHPSECPYECKHCGSCFISVDNFNTHQKAHLKANITIDYSKDFMIAKSYLCEFCERCFINYTKYKEHLSIHFGPEPYECRLHCSLKFSTLAEAVQHRVQYCPSSSSLEAYDTYRPYQCHFCNKAFSIEDALIKHIRMHTGEKPFMCDQCGKGFSQSSGLYTHQKVHSSARPYSCSLCTRTFKIKGDRDVHVRKHSGERPYRCEFCDKAFMTQHVYSQHRKIHTGERPYRCDVCGIAFRRSHVLTVHKRIHTGEKPNICIYCGKRYRQKGDMLKHCRVQHGIGSNKQS